MKKNKRTKKQIIGYMQVPLPISLFYVSANAQPLAASVYDAVKYVRGSHLSHKTNNYDDGKPVILGHCVGYDNVTVSAHCTSSHAFVTRLGKPETNARGKTCNG